MQKQLGQPVLMFFIGGEFASFVDSQSEASVESIIMTALRELDPTLPNPLSIQLTRWEQDPYARGSYSHISTQTREDDQSQFEMSGSDRLFFAGEHTIRHYFQTVHGAYLSGRREASRIVSLFK
eukprot:CAMPEP_0184048998 /NCGR_PEP_ID=MMETSP0956-20121227/3148_1 /TAXON_ID=627963 /ORGANISM="Aplanochytrium sp, Strain PBS07" /LENGTH=123 /DNA_ID=CAMNT_0026341205 /DNA_START=181 /DNA_END=552 /DNA_ORIENTATION=-